MDQAQLLALGKDLLLLISPLVAQGAIQKLGENTTDATSGLLKRAWGLLQGRLKSNDAQSALTVYQSLPNSADIQALVAQQIAAHFQADQAAITELRQLVEQLRVSADKPSAQRTHQVNVSGNAQVGTAVAGDFHGDLTVGPIDFSRKTIIAPGRSAASPQPVAPAARSRPALPSALSADGEHFSYGHALLIGVGAYQHDWLSAPTTAADARELGALLRDPQVAGYPATQVRVLTDAQATRAGILAALDDFAQRLKIAERPTAVLFFAGHGKQHESDYYLLPHDYDREHIAGSAISAALFHEKIASIRQHAQKLIVLLNCCHSGGIGDRVLDDKQPKEAGDTPPAAFYQPLVTGGGQVVISAARPWQKAGAGSPHAPAQTLFGARLLEALRGQAPGDSAGIGVFELFTYLSKHIPADATTIDYEGKPLVQEPLLYAHQLDSNIALALRPGWQGGTLDADLATMIEELAQAEIELASYAREADAPAELRAKRDALLARIEAGG